ncbi:MAG: hypothetical protein ABSC13_07520 [Dehalococcoidia bacterium]|jgi:hypothetical protein
MDLPLNVGCYSGGSYAERPQWVEREGRRLAVARINRQHREEQRLVFDVTLEDKERLILYYYPQRDAWLGVNKE